jgi:hypothetical protein
VSDSSTSSSNPLPKLAISTCPLIPRHLGHTCLSLSDDGHSLLQKSSRKWSPVLALGLCFASKARIRAGFINDVSTLKALDVGRGHCMFGVATEDVSPNPYGTCIWVKIHLGGAMAWQWLDNEQ